MLFPLSPCSHPSPLSLPLCSLLSLLFPLLLLGSLQASGVIQLSDCDINGLDTYKNFRSSFASTSEGTAMWDNAEKSVKLYVKQDTCCAGDVAFGFALKNPQAEQAAQLVSISAGPIGTSNGQFNLIYSSLAEEFDVDNGQAIRLVSESRSEPKAPLYTKSIAISEFRHCFSPPLRSCLSIHSENIELSCVWLLQRMIAGSFTAAEDFAQRLRSRQVKQAPPCCFFCVAHTSFRNLKSILGLA